ncbi:prolyl oligopeptidase family protein [Lysobacter capsici]|uniref:S9 family peptidase n=1 Tax=Lysobacter capsici TaxID=435897 RepID=UPI00071644A3|nr:DPP IV N-terminal domain-containing protein [Lysobacter capsici]ALN87101.1 prolyl oligopeptidase family protein [Lysobacter capsici]
MSRYGIWVAALLCAAVGPAWAQPASLSAQDYARAEKVLDYNLKGQLKNAEIVPHWLADGRLWYRRDGEHGAQYMLVDPAARSREPLFDPARMREAIRAVLPAAAERVPEPLSVAVEAGVLRARFAGDATQQLSCDVVAHQCRAIAANTPDPLWLPSPDGRRAVFVRDYNLWLRDLDSGRERALTQDGEAYYGYGVLPDLALHAVPSRQGRWKVPPFAVNWSPDGKRLFGSRFDERKVQPYPMLAMAPERGHRPELYNIRLSLFGDAEQTRAEWFSVDVDGAGKVQRIVAPEGWSPVIEADIFGWSADNRRVYASIANYDRPARMRLVELDLDTGRSREVLEEQSATRVQVNDFLYNRAAVRVLNRSDQVVWFSERDGWGHLYLHDLRDGRLIRRLTSGEWLVRDLIGVDETRRVAYFTAGGREAGDPYLRRLYRVSLDGGEPVLLTPEVADHALEVGASAILGGDGIDLLSPSGDYVIDNFSTLDTAPRTVLRSTRDGAIVLELERADTSKVIAAGWRAPQRVALKAADGRTDLYATVYFPPGYSAKTAQPGQYPVIDAFYGGPQVTNAPVGMAEAVSATNPISRSSLAALGFVVVTIDGRGTPGRSQAFHDVSFGAFADPQIDDHVAAIGELARRYRGLDLQRVGVYGHSFGGYSSARAILRRPEFYKVAVSSAGSHNYQGMYSSLNGMERLLAGRVDYGNGRTVRPTPEAIPENYRGLDNATLAQNLRGKLMLVYGDLDENALPAVTAQLSEALIRNNKDFDLLYLPNQNHELFRNDAYYTRRMWDYFVEHLMGAKPPVGYKLAPPPKRGGGGY